MIFDYGDRPFSFSLVQTHSSVFVEDIRRTVILLLSLRSSIESRSTMNYIKRPFHPTAVPGNVDESPLRVSATTTDNSNSSASVRFNESPSAPAKLNDREKYLTASVAPCLPSRPCHRASSLGNTLKSKCS